MLFLGFGLLIIPPQGLLGKIIFSVALIILAILRLLSPMMRERYANGIYLKKEQFTIQRGLFGILKQSYDYAGFLRIFELPTKRQMVLVFAKTELDVHSEKSTYSDSQLIWIILPTVTSPNFTQHFLHRVENDTQYQETAPNLPSIDVLKAYQSQLGQPISQLQNRLKAIISDALLTVKAILIALGGINSPLPQNTQHTKVFPKIRHSKRSAMALVMIGLIIVIISSLMIELTDVPSNFIQSIRLFALIWITGPFVWIILELYKQESGIILGEHTLKFQQPLRFFNRTIPFRQIMLPTALQNGAIALISLNPRKTAPGDDPRPPKVRLLVSSSIQNTSECLTILQEKIQQNIVPSMYRTWTVEQHIHRWRKQRALFRRFLLLVVLPAISFILFLMAMRIWTGLSGS